MPRVNQLKAQGKCMKSPGQTLEKPWANGWIPQGFSDNESGTLLLMAVYCGISIYESLNPKK